MMKIRNKTAFIIKCQTLDNNTISSTNNRQESNLPFKTSGSQSFPKLSTKS